MATIGTRGQSSPVPKKSIAKYLICCYIGEVHFYKEEVMPVLNPYDANVQVRFTQEAWANVKTTALQTGCRSAAEFVRDAVDAALAKHKRQAKKKAKTAA